MNENCIAVDIGGTKILVSEADAQGNFLHILKGDTPEGGKRDVIAEALSLVQRYEEEYGFSGGVRPDRIGIGVNGLIDPKKGLWLGYTPEEDSLDVGKMVEEALPGVRWYIDNDVKCTVTAENEFGNGGKARDMIYINVGTGLAAGIICGGKVVRGSDGFAGEVGYMQLPDPREARKGGAPKSGPVPDPERDSDMEMTASGMGLAYAAEKYGPEFPDSSLNGLGRPVNGRDVAKALVEGDAFAAALMKMLEESVSRLISDLVCVLSPEVVVLGGGLVQSEGMLERIRQNVAPKSLQHIDRGIQTTAFDTNLAGLCGAAALGLGLQEKYL